MKFVNMSFVLATLPFAAFAQLNSVADSTTAPAQVQQLPASASTPAPSLQKSKSDSSLPTIAVMDFAGRNIAAAEAGALADRFRNELTNTNKFSVMEREEMNLILKEQAFQQTGCVDQSCAVEAGQLIAVRKIITGTVAKVGGIYTVNVKEMDVATGKVDQNISEDCDCPIEKVLLETLHRIAWRIAGLKVEERKIGVEVQRGDASLFIKSDPQDASVYIDGKLVDGRTPVTLENLTPGKHTVMVKKTDMQANQEVELISNQVVRISLVMQKLKTVLRVASNPLEAETFLDRKRAITASPGQLSPAIFYDIKPGNHLVSLFKVGYADTSLNLTINEFENKDFRIDLRQITDDNQIMQQKQFVLHRKHHFAGIWLSASSLVCLAGGGVFYYLGHQDYLAAESDKNVTDASVIKAGAQYNAKVADQEQKADSYEWKKNTAYSLLGVGAAGLALGLVFFF
jgi:hypothetical protein